MRYQLEQKIENLKPGKYVEAKYEIRKKDKSPPYIVVGNGISTKDYPDELVMDAFKVFADLTSAQQRLVILLKDILIQQNLKNRGARTKADNPNLIKLHRGNHDEVHQEIKSKMGQNKNGSTLEEKRVLKKVRNGQYMLNPFMFPPAEGFPQVLKIWDELPKKAKSEVSKEERGQIDSVSLCRNQKRPSAAKSFVDCVNKRLRGNDDEASSEAENDREGP